jgi:hypothetical protein
MVSNEDECIGQTKRAKTSRQGDLRSLIDDAVIESAAVE